MREDLMCGKWRAVFKGVSLATKFDFGSQVPVKVWRYFLYKGKGTTPFAEVSAVDGDEGRGVSRVEHILSALAAFEE